MTQKEDFHHALKNAKDAVPRNHTEAATHARIAQAIALGHIADMMEDQQGLMATVESSPILMATVGTVESTFEALDPTPRVWADVLLDTFGGFASDGGYDEIRRNMVYQLFEDFGTVARRQGYDKGYKAGGDNASRVFQLEAKKINDAGFQDGQHEGYREGARHGYVLGYNDRRVDHDPRREIPPVDEMDRIHVDRVNAALGWLDPPRANPDF